jgi:hypothetical protein
VREGKSYWPDKMNFSYSRIAISRANHTSRSLSDVVEEFSSELQEDQTPNNLWTTVDVRRLSHVTAIHETACKEIKWHIVRLLKISTKIYFSQQTITKKKYETKIVQDNSGTASPFILVLCSTYKTDQHGEKK